MTSLRVVGPSSLAFLLATALAYLACGADDPAAAAADDGGSGSFDAAAAGDACAETPAPSEGQACTDNSDCTCAAVCFLNKCVRKQKCTALLSWDGPTTREDGTCLMDLAGFNIYWAADAGAFTNEIDAGMPCIDGATVACGDAGATVKQLKCGYVMGPFDAGSTIRFAVTAYSGDGSESKTSNEGDITFGACD